MKGVKLTVTWDIRELKQVFDEYGDTCNCKHGVCTTCEDCQLCALFQRITHCTDSKESEGEPKNEG